MSRATVSLVLRNNPSIPKRTRDSVLEAARELGYVYNRGAASMRAGQSRIIGVVINDLTNPYFAEIVAAIQDAMTEHERVVVLSNSAESPARQATFTTTMREYNVDAIVMCPAAGTDAAFIQRVSSWGMPCILFSRNVPDAGVDYVGPDHSGGMQEAVRHLIGLGHQRIALVGLNNRISTGRERCEGYVAALQEAGITPEPDLMIACPATRADGMAAIQQLLDRDTPPTAAACFNDVLAFGVMLGLMARQLKPGGDFSVVGFDDIAEASLWRPTLTTVAVSRPAIGEAIVSLLNRRLADRDAPARSILIPTRLVVRESASRLEKGRGTKKS